jgi:hypothetical protein
MDLGPVCLQLTAILHNPNVGKHQKWKAGKLKGRGFWLSTFGAFRLGYMKAIHPKSLYCKQTGPSH